MSRGLILVDIQNDYFPGGAMELVGMEQAAERAAEALAAFRGEGLAVFHVQHLAAQPGATFFLPGTPGAEIHPSVAPREGEVVVQKHFPNSFRGTPLLDRLRERDVTELTLCGAMSHMCIDATTRAAFDLGFSCTVLADASPFDILISHTPPARTNLDRTARGEHVGSEAVRRWIATARPALLVCGHIHESWGVERVEGVLCLNAGALGEPYGEEIFWLVRWSTEGPIAIRSFHVSPDGEPDSRNWLCGAT